MILIYFLFTVVKAHKIKGIQIVSGKKKGEREGYVLEHMTYYNIYIHFSVNFMCDLCYVTFRLIIITYFHNNYNALIVWKNMEVYLFLHFFVYLNAYNVVISICYVNPHIYNILCYKYVDILCK